MTTATRRVSACILAALLAGTLLAPAAQAATDSPDVDGTVRVQQALAEAGFYRGPVDGVAGKNLQDAIMAFHKTVGAERTSQWSRDDWNNLRALHRYGYDIPDRSGEPDRIEVDLYRQVMFLIEGGELAAVFPIVSGRGDTYERLGRRSGGAHTPVGDFEIIRHVAGWRHGSYGPIYRPWYFIGGYAIHGSRVARPQPASNGCVRVPMDDMDWLEDRLELGMPVHVWVGRQSTVAGMVRLQEMSAAFDAVVV